MQITTKQILTIIYIVSWVIFIGICIEAGGLLVYTLYPLFVDTTDFSILFQKIDLSHLYQYDSGHFYVLASMMSLVSILKAILFYLIIKILYDRKFNFTQPFTNETARFIFNISFLTLLIGLFSIWAMKYAEWLHTKTSGIPDPFYLKLGGADVWLFMSVTLFVIALIFKRGIEIQSENELTV